jgi:hypothetical protein
MTNLNDSTSPNYFRIALQSALAAALCLGLPAGLLLWLILIDRVVGSTSFQRPIDFLNKSGLYSIYILATSSLMWSYLLARISHYRRWWKIALATALAILGVWFSPLSNVDGILYNANPDLPIHLNYAASMVGLVGSVTLFVGLAYGIVLKNIRAAFVIGLTASFVSVCSLLITILVFDYLRVRVGMGNMAMPRVTVISLLASSITGGMVLGVLFSGYVHRE